MAKKGQVLTDAQKTQCRIAKLRKLYGDSVPYLHITHPHLATQWHPTKNIDPPSTYTAASDAVVWWICPNQCDKGCPHEWQAAIGNRAKLETGCPYCARKRICVHQSIVETHPTVAPQFHPTKNGLLKASDIAYGSKKLVWWLCPRTCSEGCAHEYQAAPLNRCGVNQQGCPFCWNQQICKHSSIAFTHPAVAAQWCYEKNTLLPTQISKGCSKQAWWICSKGHSYPAIIKNRCNGSGCNLCTYKVSKAETEWLNYLEVSRGTIQRQFRVPGIRSSLDGAQPEQKIGFMFHGDYYHGHPRYARDAINPTSKKTFGQLFRPTGISNRHL